MAKLELNKKKIRIFAHLICFNCINKELSSYYVIKSKKLGKRKLSFNKYCKICNCHTNFTER